MNDSRRGRSIVPIWVLEVLAVTLLWPTVEFLGAAIGRHYHAAQIVGMRYAVHLLVLAAVCVSFGARHSLLATGRLPMQLVRGACMFVMPAAFLLATSYQHTSSVWAIFWVAPLVTIGLARASLGERVPPRTWLLAVLGYLGALAIIRPDLPSLGWGAAFAVLMASSLAVYTVVSRYLRAEPVMASLFYTGAVALAGALPFMIAEWQPIRTEDIGAIVGLGIAGLALLLFLDRTLQHTPASRAAPFLYCVVAWGPLFEGVHMSSNPSLVSVAGSLVVFGAAIASLAGAAVLGAQHE